MNDVKAGVLQNAIEKALAELGKGRTLVNI